MVEVSVLGGAPCWRGSSLKQVGRQLALQNLAGKSAPPPPDAHQHWLDKKTRAILRPNRFLKLRPIRFLIHFSTSSGVRLCWELEKPKGPKGLKDHGPCRG